MMNRNDMYEPILTVMATAEGEGLHRKAIASQIEDWFTLTEDEWAELRKTHKVDKYSTKFQKEVDYALNHLRNAGLSSGSSSHGRGYHQITEQGRKILEIVAADDIPSKVQDLVRENKQKEQNQVAKTKEENTKQTLTEGPAAWREVLLDILQNMPPEAFERLCQRLLRESGFIEVEVTGRAGDGGIDGRGIIRLAGLIGFPVLFQCKRYSGNVGPNVVRDFRGAMAGRAEKGVILTTGGFTRDAQREAIRDGATPIDLIDGELLMEKMKELRLGMRAKMVEVVEVDKQWFASFSRQT